MSDKKIKSVITLKDLPGIKAGSKIEKINKEENGFLILDQNHIEKYPDWYKVEYEEPVKPRLRFPNGAEIEAPELGTIYWCISYGGYITEDTFDGYSSDLRRLQRGNFFLSEANAEKVAEAQEIKARLVAEVIKINADNDWVASWHDKTQQKYFLHYDQVNSCFYRKWRSDLVFRGEIFMCEEAADYLLSDKVSDFERHCFLEIWDYILEDIDL